MVVVGVRAQVEFVDESQIRTQFKFILDAQHKYGTVWAPLLIPPE
jgi:hypothetical protein